jgi:hypothetical protein
MGLICFHKAIAFKLLTAEMVSFLFSFVIMLYTIIVLLCTNIWSSFDTSDINLSEIEHLFCKPGTFSEQMHNGLE